MIYEEPLQITHLNGKQRSSVMCVYSKCSDSAHPQFWLNCLPNEEEIYQMTFKKSHILIQSNWSVIKKMFPTQITSVVNATLVEP